MSTRRFRTNQQLPVIMVALISMISIYCVFSSFTSTSFQSDTDDTRLKEIRKSLHGRVVRNNDEVKLEGFGWMLWRDDDPGSPCVNLKTRFGWNLVRVWLVSFPSSGNTWTRYLLEASTGIFTGSVFNDKTLFNAGFLGEKEPPDSGRTIVQKTHGGSLSGNPKEDLLDRYLLINSTLPAILLLRHPAKSFISYWKLLRTRNAKDKHTGQLSEKMFETNSFHRYVEQVTRLWEQLAVDTLLWSVGPLHVVHYEDLVADTDHHLRQLLYFLRVPMDEDRLSCVRSHLTGNFKRVGNKELDPFTTREKIKMTLAIQRVNRLLLVLGYPEFPYIDNIFHNTTQFNGAR
ncbi:WSC domain-containing protein 1-like isoform X2 [Homarus americanus]|uniref:WSC domain-containing protein 1-like isoform X2 n=1 Tax=Homarus americanus TaxID=6706 RepID=UPI001C43803C|nr:WSC domain-containing protein 1-like isoform X2 [Homarus americanus]